MKRCAGWIGLGVLLLAPLLFTPAGQRALTGIDMRLVAEPAMLACERPWVGPDEALGCYSAALQREVDADGPASVARLNRYAADHPRLGNRCHFLMHEVAERWAEKTRTTPREFAASMPDYEGANCGSGLVHGVLIQATRNATSDELRELVSLCAGLESFGREVDCVHGLGHAQMRAVDGEFAAAMDWCAGLSRRWARSECIDAATMEFWFGVMGMEGSPSQEAPDPPEALCSALAGADARVCVRRSLASGFEGADAGTILKHCDAMSGAHRDGCLAAFGFAKSVTGDRSHPPAFQACAQLEPADVTACLSGIDLKYLPPETIVHCQLVGGRGLARWCTARLAQGLAVAHDLTPDELCAVIDDQAREQTCRASAADDGRFQGI